MPDRLLPGHPILVIAWVGGGILAVFMIVAAVAGDVGAEGGRIMDLAWGRVLLLDAYLGFAIFGAWMAWREGSRWRAVCWIASLLLLGNVVACAYLLLALRAAGGTSAVFWHGHRANAHASS